MLSGQTDSSRIQSLLAVALKGLLNAYETVWICVDYMFARRGARVRILVATSPRSLASFPAPPGIASSACPSDCSSPLRSLFLGRGCEKSLKTASRYPAPPRAFLKRCRRGAHGIHLAKLLLSHFLPDAKHARLQTSALSSPHSVLQLSWQALAARLC